MNKNLRLYWRITTYHFDFFQGKFTGENHSAEAGAESFFCSSSVIDSSLCAQMKCHVGNSFHEFGTESSVLQNKGIRSDISAFFSKKHGFSHLAFADQRIQCHMYAHTVPVSKSHSFFQRLICKIVCVDSRVERGSAEIDRIGSVGDGGFQLFVSSRRDQEFRYLLLLFFSHNSTAIFLMSPGRKALAKRHRSTSRRKKGAAVRHALYLPIFLPFFSFFSSFLCVLFPE